MFPKAVFAPIGQVTGPIGWKSPAPINDVYVFDLDTLVPSPKGRMDVEFARYLTAFANKRPCYILSNTSITDIMARVPSSLRAACAGLYAAGGTELWVRDELVLQHEHDFSDDLYEFMVKVIQTSAYPEKRAPMLENGSATLRLCIAGYQSTLREIGEYAAWEGEHDELSTIIHEFNARFPDYCIHRDTATSLLIVPKTFSSDLVMRHLLKRHKNARLVGYMTPAASSSYAAALSEAFGSKDVLSIIAGPSDVSQLLSYEFRRLLQQEQNSAAPALEKVEA
ncbi:hypothetical protein E1180_12785 [Roseibium denhamense]|uniref:HAD family hydrolase n=1 Tax=Roseibium denhamense TaxID=76305 RepID=A0ABY1NG14_9HYPH|nr:hypothetical protein [Roseibium denhamense]MTI06392.1 hypothetical protein [Roseibium denhamense]SMP08802.1 hypothetical protein SAMN06265374_1022 [Roseibium denhamense]